MYRTHTCGELRASHAGQTVTLAGWVNRRRDHGGVAFFDLRDRTGLVQITINPDLPKELLEQVANVRFEWVLQIEGLVQKRPDGMANPKMETGEIEIIAKNITILNPAKTLPFMVSSDADLPDENTRLKYRYLDLRRERLTKNMVLRHKVIKFMRDYLDQQGFIEIETPIMFKATPEGARDYLVPSRLHPGKFYALPQSPQQFKQLLMVAGFDRYFQVAPCFRDEDGRADRLAEHYQLDVEMSFVTEQEVHDTMTPVIKGLFEEFADWTGTKHKVEWLPKLTYKDAMLKYGSDKPDLRNPLVITDVTEVFARADVTFNAFKGFIAKGGCVRAIRVPKVASQPRSFFDKLNSWAQGEGAPGLGYIAFETEEGKGPIAKFVAPEAQKKLRELTGIANGDVVFFVCNTEAEANKLAGAARDRICDDAGLREKGVYKFCWIVDFPMYEFDEKHQKIEFSHNPFSMPQGGLETLEKTDPLQILAHQYDCVCNGFEISSGAIRNHRPDIMEKAFALAGYPKDVLERKFSGMLNAFRFGAPPHGGCAFGIDRLVMILAHEPNLREVNAFVMNGQYEDPMMNAPSEPTAEQLKDLHIRLDLPKQKKTEAA